MANEQTRGPTDFAAQTTNNEGNMRGRAREAVSQAKDRAGERIESRIADSKNKAADTLSGVASTLLSSSQQLRDQQHDGASRAIERAAEGVDRFAHYLQDTDVDDVVDQVHEFARRQPAAFIGGAFALGFIASRFLKASGPYNNNRHLPVPTDTGRSYQAEYGTTRSYESEYRTGYETDRARESVGQPGGYSATGGSDGGTR